MAQRNGRGAVCVAPVARRIGGVGLGAQRRIERAVLDVEHLGVFELRGEARGVAVFVGVVIVDAWFDVEADGGDAAMRVSLVGLVAAETI